MVSMLAEARFRDAALEPVREKVLQGRRLSAEDGIALYRTHDLLALGGLANHVREQRHGDAAYFVWNTHLNHTNVCAATCDFCAFAATRDEPRAYTMSLDDVFGQVEKLPRQVREVHIVGGLHPDLPWSYFTDMMRGIKRVRPDIHVKAFTAVEIFFFHRLYRMGVEQVLAELKEAGLDSMPGGGAEIFARETRDKIIRGKANAEQWLDVMRTAHRLGIPSNATMLYGHIESIEDRVDHLLRLRELQDETGGFVTYIPLAFQPWEAPAMKCPETTGFDDLKAIAVGRLMLDNFPHIKSYWIMIGARLAQVGLSFGADDIDGTVTEEKIAHDAGASTPQADDRARPLPAHPRGGTASHRARHRLQRGEGMVGASPLRLGVVSYLNAEPLVFGLEKDPAFDLQRDVPSRVAERLHAGEIDLGMIPSIEYARGDYAMVPGVAIASRGAVRSVRLLHRGRSRTCAAWRSTAPAAPARRCCGCCCASAWAAIPSTCRCRRTLPPCWRPPTPRC